jgi:hypothetical protein
MTTSFLKAHGPFLLYLACYLLGGLSMWAYSQQSGPTNEMSAKEVRQAKQAVADKKQEAAAQNTKADTTTAHAAAPYRAAQAAEKQALTLHAQSHALRRPLRAPADSSPAAVDSLTRFFATY